MQGFSSLLPKSTFGEIVSVDQEVMVRSREELGGPFRSTCWDQVRRAGAPTRAVRAFIAMRISTGVMIFNEPRRLVFHSDILRWTIRYTFSIPFLQRPGCCFFDFYTLGLGFCEAIYLVVSIYRIINYHVNTSSLNFAITRISIPPPLAQSKLHSATPSRPPSPAS